MQTKHLCVLIHIRTKGEVGAPLNWFKPSFKFILLRVPRRYFFCASFMSLSVLCLLCLCTCLFVPGGHLLGKS